MRWAIVRFFTVFALCMAGATLAGPAASAGASAGSAPTTLRKVDRVLVLKGGRKLLLLSGQTPIRSYRIALGSQPTGHKIQRDDGRTPEGTYRLDWRNPQSRFHRSIHISYPAPADAARAQRRGISPGSAIMIHGLPNGRGWVGPDHARFDWTDGCIAVTDAEMDEIWALVDNGTPIEIRP